MSQPFRGRNDNLVFRSAQNTNLVEALRSFDEFRLAVSEKNAKMSQPIGGPGSFLFPINPKKTQTW